jgi:hypothetical protein
LRTNLTTRALLAWGIALAGLLLVAGITANPAGRARRAAADPRLARSELPARPEARPEAR